MLTGPKKTTLCPYLILSILFESEITFLGTDQSISIISHFAKSRTATNGPNSRRTDLSYGVDFS